jgi:hypothetical protein
MSKPEEVKVAEVSLKDTAIQALQRVDVGIADLREQYLGKVYEVTTTVGMDEAKKARAAIRECRYQVPKIAKEAADRLNQLKKDIKGEAERITTALLEIEEPIDAQIKAEEELKEAERVEKARLAAENQRILDDKIIRIAKLPITVVGRPSEEIRNFIETIESRELGVEFTGETRDRAEKAKAEALEEMREILVDAENNEAQDEAQRLADIADAARREDERLERERIQAENDARQAELDAQAKIQAEKQAALDAQMEAFEAEKRAEREKLEAEQESKDAAERARLQAEKKEADRLQKEKEAEARRKAEAQAEVDRKAREKAEAEKKAAEKEKKLALAKLSDATSALKKILAICRGLTQSPVEKLADIELVAEANIA